MTLWKRILVEKRALAIPLALGAIVNIGAYGLWVYPLGVRSAGAADRAAAATQALDAAEREQAAARELVLGKSRADEELKTFFENVLPADQAAARRLTYSTLPALARKSNVKMVARRFDVEPITKKTRLGLLKVHTQWLCDYESFRQFVYAFESASPFVIIDEVSLQQNDPNRPLSLTLNLSTYYRLSAHGD